MTTTPNPPSGCASWYQPDLFQPATLTSAASTTCARKTLRHIPSATFLLASVAGRSLWPWQESARTPACGLALAPASHSAQPVSAREPQTSGTSGQSSGTSSLSASLQQSLESRLRVLTEERGCPLYALKWKHWAMESGPQICALRGSVRRISGSDSTSSGWPTPTANSTTGAGTQGRDGGMNIQTVAQMAGWPTPTAADGNRGNGTIRPHDTGIPLPQRAAMAGWPTPTTLDHKGATEHTLVRRNGKTRHDILDHCALLTKHLTPNGPARLTASGLLLTGSTAGMESGGQLSPEHSRWLMGYPAGWHSSGDTETP